MTIDLAALIVSALLTTGLTFRDPALAETREDRAFLAAAWLVSAIAMGFAGHREGIQWIGVTILLTACLATGGRPALIMENVLPARTTADEQLMRRSRVGQVAVILAVVVAVFVWAA